MIHQDTTTFEIGEARLSLRDNLRFSIQRGRYGKSYIVEDESTAEFYRIGEAEYTFLSMLDGQTTVATALATTCSLRGTSSFNEQDAAHFCKWLVDSGLANTRASTSSRRIGSRQSKADDAAARQNINPISIRIPLWSPDPVVSKANKYLGWVLTMPMAVVWLFVCSWALLSAISASDRFANDLQVFSSNNALWLAATWLLLKLGHEFCHAVACKKYGGRVGKSGILLLLLVPLPFVDVTSSWRFGNKRHRILVSAAGMLFELFVAAIAALIWVRVGPGMVSQAAANVMVAASINTILFNANPLMRFDGYHILADWIEIPNLAKYGNQFVVGACRKHLLGLHATPIPWGGVRGHLVRIYGVASLLWKLLICATLLIAAANLLPGLGFAFALVGAILWIAIPVVKFGKYFMLGNQFEQPNRWRFTAILFSALFLCGLLGLTLPSPSVITAPVVIGYEPLSVVRAEAAGFLESIEVSGDEIVKENQLLALLADPELELRRIEAESELKESRLRASSHRKRRNIAAWQIEQETQRAIKKRIIEIEEQERQLELRAPTAGRVLGEDIDSLVGTHIRAGTEVLSIGRCDSKEAIALVSQGDDRYLRGSLGRNVSLRVWGNDSLESGVVRKINPRVTAELPHLRSPARMVALWM